VSPRKASAVTPVSGGRRVADTGTVPGDWRFDLCRKEKSMNSPGTPASGVRRRGFASLTPERRKEIATLGGRSVPEEKRSFSKDRDLARQAGRKGGAQSSQQRKGDA
jgi:general stress protein YciG